MLFSHPYLIPLSCFLPVVWSHWFSCCYLYVSSLFPPQHLCVFAVVTVWKSFPLDSSVPYLFIMLRSVLKCHLNESFLDHPAYNSFPLLYHCLLFSALFFFTGLIITWHRIINLCSYVYCLTITSMKVRILPVLFAVISLVPRNVFNTYDLLIKHLAHFW